MKVFLDYHTLFWPSVSFNTKCGTGHFRWYTRKPIEYKGWAYKHRCVWYAVRSDGENIIFHAGRRQWAITDRYQYEYREEGRKSTFRILDGDKVEFEITYKNPTYWLINRLDVTYDYIDRTTDDFFLYLIDSIFDPEIRAAWVKHWA